MLCPNISYCIIIMLKNDEKGKKQDIHNLNENKNGME